LRDGKVLEEKTPTLIAEGYYVCRNKLGEILTRTLAKLALRCFLSPVQVKELENIGKNLLQTMTGAGEYLMNLLAHRLFLQKSFKGL